MPFKRRLTSTLLHTVRTEFFARYYCVFPCRLSKITLMEKKKRTAAAMPAIVDENILHAASEGVYHSPHDILGPHINEDCKEYTTVRILKPLAEKVTVIAEEGEYEAKHEHNGIFAAVVPSVKNGNEYRVPNYLLRVKYENCEPLLQDDPYRYLPTLGETDLYLFNEGRHEQLWKVLGAHVRSYPSSFDSPYTGAKKQISGTSFAVWAPNAHAVRLICDSNGWNGQTHAMRTLGSSGIWELFVPGIKAGEKYKFEILNANGEWKQKADPFENEHQIPPETASKVYESAYSWTDGDWMEKRKKTNAHLQPVSVYEVHAPSWKEGLSYRDLAVELVEYVKENGFTHVEFMPLTQHPFQGSWGYQVTGYFAADSRLGSPDDLKYLIDSFHNAGIGVIMDWVPAHFPKDDFALARFDGTPLFEDPDPLRGEHPDWGTYIFNYGRNEVRNFLMAGACFWIEEFHVDALRVDAVSSMLYLDYSRENGNWRPNIYGGRENLEAISLLKEINTTVYRNYPGIMMIAEESTSWKGVTAPVSEGGLGFGLKWNMGWMHDTLEYLKVPSFDRGQHHDEITFSMVYAYSEHYILPLSHDETVHGKGSLFGRMPGDDWQRYAGVRALLAYQWSHPGKKLNFMGNELAQYGEWDFEHSVDWDCLNWREHRQIQQLVKDLNDFYKNNAQLWELDFEPEGFQWLTSDDAEHNTLCYMRLDSKGSPIVVATNFSASAWSDYRIPLPSGGQWEEVFTTDDLKYGGSGIRNADICAEEKEFHSRSFSARITVPALGTVFLKPKEG